MPIPLLPTTNLGDRIRETSVGTGTTALALGGAVLGYRSFASTIGNGGTAYYCISDQSGPNFEIGIGVYTTSGSSLARNTVLSSSNANALVNFTAGTKDVFVTLPASVASLISMTATLFTGTQVVTVANTGSESTLLGSGVGSLTIPSARQIVGANFRFKASGFWSTLAAVAGNMTMNLKCSSTVLATTGAIAVPLSLSNNYWDIVADITIFTVSGSGTMWTQGRMLTQIAANATQIAGMVTTSSQVITPLSSALNLTATWSVANALNTITCTNVALDSVN